MESVSRLERPEPDSGGPILLGTHGEELQALMADAVFRYRCLRETQNPALCYIAAWEMGKNDIWYEYADERFIQLFGCTIEELPAMFRDRIMERRLFTTTARSDDIHSEIIRKDQLLESWEKLREETLHQGTADALYKVSLGKNQIIWLKDQAKVSQFPENGLCVSFGNLSFVTREMDSYLAMADREAVLRTLFGFSPMPILLADPATGRILDANETFCQLMDKTRYQILTDDHKKWLEIKDARDPFRFNETSDTGARKYEVRLLPNAKESVDARMFTKIIPIADQPFLLVGFDREVLGTNNK